MPSTSSRKSKRSDYSLSSRRRHHRPSSTSRHSRPSSPPKNQFTIPRPLNIAIIVLSFCLINTFNFESQYGHSYLRSRRYLLGPPTLSEGQIQRSRSHHLFPVDYMPDETERTVAWFDHDTVTDGDGMFGLFQCLSRDHLAVHSSTLGGETRFQLYEGDRKRILDLPKFRQVMSKEQELLIITNEPYDTVDTLFDRQNRGRMMALFNNPVHRSIQRFMQQQGGGTNPKSMMEWINNQDYTQDNTFVKKLLGKRPEESVNLVDLQMAKEFVRQSVVVGLGSEMKESFGRFNLALGYGQERLRGNAECLEDIFRRKEENFGVDKFNKMVPPNSKEWNAIAQRNYLDMALYTYIEKLFEEYDGVFNLFPQDEEDDTDEEIDPSPAAGDETEEVTPDSNTEKQPAIQETAEEREARIIKNSPYAEPDEVEGAAVEVTESEAPQNENSDSAVDPKAALKRRLADVSSLEFGNGKAATPFFWHVPKAGGTAIQNLYWCMGLTLANEVGGNPKLLARKKVQRNALTIFQPWKNSGNNAKVINVDVTTHKGIDEAIRLGFLTKKDQPKTDFVSSSLFHVVSMKLFSKDQKARMFALFRHPVDRAVSKFYYLSKATWEPTYDETWANMTLEEWATNDRGENNWLVHHLAGKKHYETVDRHDLEMAKEMIRSKFIVGMMNKFDESVHRFNLLLGVDEKEPANKQCMAEFAHENDTSPSNNHKKRDMANRNSYTKAEEGSLAWKRLAEINSLDVELFSFIEEQFNSQRKLFEQYEAQRIIFEQMEAQRKVVA